MRKLLGGGMRQAGIIAAAGLVALDTMVDRLAEDHQNARALAQGLTLVAGINVRPVAQRTNMVHFDIDGDDSSAGRFGKAMKERGVLISRARGHFIQGGDALRHQPRGYRSHRLGGFGSGRGSFRRLIKMDSLQSLFGLRGHLGLVTGASSGLGVECAHALALAGADVVLVARRADRCEKLAELAKKYGVRAIGIGADVPSRPISIASSKLRSENSVTSIS